MKTATTSLPDVTIVKIDSPTKKTLLGVNVHNPIWLLLQSTSIDRLKEVLTTLLSSNVQIIWPTQIYVIITNRKM